MSRRPELLLNADVRTLRAGAAPARALAWREGRLIAVGSQSDVERAAGSEARTWDAGGKTVVPGFVDAHHHASIGALYGGLVRLAPPEVTDIASLQLRLAAAARQLPSEQWLVATDWDELLLAERRAPTRSELDDAVPDRPVMALHYSCHRALANSRALELAGIDRSTPDPSGGAISRGPGALPDGLLIERGMSRVESLARRSLLAHDLEGLMQRLHRHHRALVAAGITRIVDAAVPADLAEVYREAQRRGLLLVPTVMLPVSVRGYFEAPWDALDAPATGTHEGLLTTGPVKLVFDGAPACAMCLSWWQTGGMLISAAAHTLRQRSLDVVRTALSVRPRFGARIRTGIHIYDGAEARQVVGAALDRGFAVATHAIGNAAVDVALDAYEASGSRLHSAGMPRIEHAIFIDREQVARIAGIGAAVVTQPHFMSLPAFAAAPSIPGLGNTPLRWLLDQGVEVAGSSDFPVASFEPLDGIRSALSRRTARGRVLDPDQRLSLDEALAIYTRGAATASHCLSECGTLEAGKRADFVLLDGRLTESELVSLRVSTTVIAGEVVHGSLTRAGPSG